MNEILWAVYLAVVIVGPCLFVAVDIVRKAKRGEPVVPPKGHVLGTGKPPTRVVARRTP